MVTRDEGIPKTGSMTRIDPGALTIPGGVYCTEGALPLVVSLSGRFNHLGGDNDHLIARYDTREDDCRIERICAVLGTFRA